MRILLLTLVLICLVWRAEAQFPRVCAQNASAADGGVCCPVPEGFAEPCGGAGWGSCVPLPLDSIDISHNSEALLSDPRLAWPTRFFMHGCQCEGNRMGYACQDCKYGWEGPNCSIKKALTVRKNALNLTAEERKEFVDALLLLKSTESEYVIIKEVVESEGAQFFNVTVYDFYTHLQYLAIRRYGANGEPLCVNTGHSEQEQVVVLDFAHSGPGFLTWHRLLLMSMERELQHASGNPTLGIPYWNWAGQETNCSVCTNDLFGETDSTDPEGKLLSDSAFSNWTVPCRLPQNESNSFCQLNDCDPELPAEHLQRQIQGNNKLPTEEDEVASLLADVFDEAPYNKYAPESSFRNRIEGYVSDDGLATTTNTLTMNQMVRKFFRGHLSYDPAAPADPLFYSHHSYIDKVFTIWMRLKGVANVQYPPAGSAPIGHNENDATVPFYPVLRHSDVFRDPQDLGYDYDNMEESTLIININTAGQGNTLLWIMVVLLLNIIIVILCVFIARLLKKKKEIVATVEEKQPLLAPPCDL